MIKVSVVIPTYGRADSLRDCVQALAASDFPRDEFEVIIVDDGSPKLVGPELAALRDRLDPVIIRQENAGAAAARNLGARHARGRYLAFTDDDCLPGPGWLRALVLRLESAPDIVVGGEITNAASDNTYSRVTHLLAHKVYARYDSDPSSIRFFGSANLAIAKDQFEKWGGFDAGLRPAYEDREFCERLFRHGIRFVRAL